MATSPFIGELRTMSFGFPPKGWASCNGALLPIAQNQALFSILGTTYGGNGVQTFGLPNLQGRVAVGTGNGFTLGQVGGSATVTLQSTQIPVHTHNANAFPTTAVGPSAPGPTVLLGQFGVNAYATSANTAMAAGTVGNSVGGQPHENRQPFLTVNVCIALQGIYPSRS
jgi:microcystin-dependent protein